MRQRERGLTLVEMMVVITLLALLTVAIGTKVWEKFGGAKVGIAKTQLGTVREQVELYNMNEKRYPAALQDLLKPSKALAGGTYLEKKQLSDPWGNPLAYNVPGPAGRPFELLSFGSDGKMGGEGEAADLSVWDEE